MYMFACACACACLPVLATSCLPPRAYQYEAGYNLLVSEPHPLSAPATPDVEAEATAKLEAVLEYVYTHRVFKYCRISLLTQASATNYSATHHNLTTT